MLKTIDPPSVPAARESTLSPEEQFLAAGRSKVDFKDKDYEDGETKGRVGKFSFSR